MPSWWDDRAQAQGSETDSGGIWTRLGGRICDLKWVYQPLTEGCANVCLPNPKFGRLSPVYLEGKKGKGIS